MFLTVLFSGFLEARVQGPQHRAAVRLHRPDVPGHPAGQNAGTQTGE